jgi:hypothetical protein
MIILQETGSAQNLDFIPRSFTTGTTYNVSIVNEQTNTTVYNQNTTAVSEVLYYNRYNAAFGLKQDNFYMLTIKAGTDVVFKDKIFCTNQTVADYTVNNSQYTSNDTTNDFIFA